MTRHFVPRSAAISFVPLSVILSDLMEPKLRSNLLRCTPAERSRMYVTSTDVT